MVVAGFVVLGIAAQHIRRRQDDLAGKTVTQPGVGNRHLPGTCPGTIAHFQRAVDCSRRCLTVDFDPEGAGQQGKGRWQQGISARRQAWNTGTDADLLANAWITGARLAKHRCIGVLIARHDGVHRIAAQARQAERAISRVANQWVETRIGRTATPGDKPGTAQIPAPGKVDQRACLRIDVLGTQDHPGIFVGNPLQHHGLAVVAVVGAIGCAAVRHDQSGAADRGHAARQQVNGPGIAKGIVTQRDQAQGCANDPALLDIPPVQFQPAEHRIRRHGRCRTIATDAQRTVGIDPALALIPGAYIGPDPSARIDLCRAQVQITGRPHPGTRL
ncbi:hypothetical protein D3C84_566440 [compost metagenome]